MNPLAISLGNAAATVLINEWLAWQQRRSRPAGYVWTPADIAEFLKQIDADTPAAIRAEVAAEDAKPTV
jgi:hypothetical protein